MTPGDFGFARSACRQGGFVSGRRARRRQRRFWKPTNSKCCLPAATREQPKPCRPGDASPEEAKTKNGTAGLAFHKETCYAASHANVSALPAARGHRHRRRLHSQAHCRTSAGEPARTFLPALWRLELGATEWRPARHGVPRADVEIAPRGPHRAAAGAAKAAESSGGAQKTSCGRGGHTAATRSSGGNPAAGVPLGAAHAGRTAVQQPARAISLSPLQTAGRGTPEISGLRRRAAGGLFCVVLVGTLPGLPGPLSRLVGPGAA